MCIFSGLSAANLTWTPSNTAVVAGAQIVLRCETDLSRNNSIKWLFWSDSNISSLLIYTAFKIHTNLTDRYMINERTRPGQYDLIINTTRLSDAGKYRCNEVGRSTSAEAELIVLGNVCRKLQKQIMQYFQMSGSLMFLNSVSYFYQHSMF